MPLSLSVRECEQLFSALQRPTSYPRKVQGEQLIDGMTTPTQVSLFLSYFRDYDVNTTRRETLVETVLKMNPPSPERVLMLIKSLVLRGAKVG